MTHPAQTLCAESFCKFYQSVDLLSGKFACKTLCVDCPYAALYHSVGNVDCKRVGKHLESAVCKQVGAIHDFHSETSVGLVAAVRSHGFFISHGAEMTFAEVETNRLFENIFNKTLDRISYVFYFFDETHFDIYLSKFGLTVRPQVLVSETFCDLVISVIARNHQKLFIKLRRLRKGVKTALVHSRRNEIISCALGSGTTEHRRFYLHKAVVVEIISRCLCNFRTNDEFVLQRRSSEVEISVFETKSLVYV